MKTKAFILVFLLSASQAYAWGDREQAALLGFVSGVAVSNLYCSHPGKNHKAYILASRDHGSHKFGYRSVHRDFAKKRHGFHAHKRHFRHHRKQHFNGNRHWHDHGYRR